MYWRRRRRQAPCELSPRNEQSPPSRHELTDDTGGAGDSGDSLAFDGPNGQLDGAEAERDSIEFEGQRQQQQQQQVGELRRAVRVEIGDEADEEDEHKEGDRKSPAGSASSLSRTSSGELRNQNRTGGRRAIRLSSRAVGEQRQEEGQGDGEEEEEEEQQSWQFEADSLAHDSAEEHLRPTVTGGPRDWWRPSGSGSRSGSPLGGRHSPRRRWHRPRWVDERQRRQLSQSASSLSPSAASGAAHLLRNHFPWPARAPSGRHSPHGFFSSTSSIFALYAARYAFDKFQLALRSFKEWYHEQLTYNHLANRMEFNQQHFERWFKSRGRPLALRALDHYDRLVIWIAGELVGTLGAS